MRGIAKTAFLATACGCAIPSAALAQAVNRTGPVSGRVIAVTGGEQGRLVPSPQWRPLARGQQLKQGDVLRTNSTGTLALLFADRTQVRLGRNATMAVNAVAAGSPSQLTLSAGKAWGRSPSRQTNLSVRTPSATAAIRGTEWSLSADEDSTALEVFDGEVELANEFGSVRVGAGEAARVRRGEAPVKVTIANPDGREQMLYFVRAEDALGMMGSHDPRLGEARRLVYAGQWEQAEARFAAMQTSEDPATRAAGAYGSYVARLQLGREGSPPAEEDEPNNYLGRALIAAYAGDLREALAIADAGLARFPGARGLYLARIRVAFLLGQPAVARQTLDEARAKYPQDSMLAGLEAEYLIDYAGSPRAALGVARGAAAKAPEDADLQAILARIWLQLGGLNEARAAVDRALTLRPQDAGLMALRAEILLAQNEVGAARQSLDAAVALEPDLSIVRMGLAEYQSRTGHRQAALDEALAASAGNPAFGRGFVKLAEMSYDDRRPSVAIQQLDAADRLDPHGPAVPLARTAIALHRFDADGAIESARDALARYQGRGGEYSNLSENQQSGSLVSQSFRFLNLEGWGRYYGDRAFDSFSPISYPDQVLNRTPSPFVIRAIDGSFDSFNGADADYVSSFLQGAVLAPLSVIDAQKDLLFSRRNFFEGSIGGSHLTESRRTYYGGNASATGIVNGAVPFGYNISFEGYRLDDSIPQINISPYLDDRRHDERTFQGLFGFEVTPRDKFVSIVRDYRATETSLFDNDAGMLPNRGPGQYRAFDVGLRQTSAALFWEHELGYRNAITVGGLYARTRNPAVLDFPVDNVFRATLDTGSEHYLLSVNYARSFGQLDTRTGIELSSEDVSDHTLLQTDTLSGFIDVSDCVAEPELCEAFGFDGELFNILADDKKRYRDVRPYLDLRSEIGSWLILQGQASYLLRTIQDLNDPATTPYIVPTRTEKFFDYQLGAAVEPTQGQWLRGAVISRTATDQDFTFAPIASVGLRGTIAPASRSARTTSYVARWDAEWMPHFFTNVEFQHQDLGGLEYKVPSTDIAIAGGRAELDRIGVEANLWIGGNLGVRIAYAHTDARVRDVYSAVSLNDESGYQAVFAPGDRLPYVPRNTGQFALTWAHAAPWRARAEFSVDYLGDQIGGNGDSLPGYAVVNLKSEVEPFSRAVRLEAGVLNILDKRFVEGPGVRGPGRTARIALTYRF